MTERTSTSPSLGELIRERRLGLGLSLGQLATEVSTSANQVRRWERGEEAPEPPAQEILAEFLGIEADVVASLAEAAAPAADEEIEEPETPTELFSAASGVSPASVSPPEEPAAAQAPEREPPERAPEPEPEVDQVEEEEPDEPTEPATSPEEDLPEESHEVAAAPVEHVAVPPAPAAASEKAAPAPRPLPLRYPESVPPGVPVEITEPEPNRWNPLRYLYDPEKPWLYWVRAALTVVVLLVLVNILFDSVSELFDKLGELLDTIEPTETVEETSEALGR